MIGNNNRNLLAKLETYVLLLKIGLTALAFILFIRRSWAGEDAFIFFRYVDNFINGQGLVFNIGERVEGFTAPLWVFLLSGVSMITDLGLRQISIITGLFLSTSAILIILYFDSTKKLFIPIGVILLITNSAFRDFATSGFETSLTYLLLTILAILVKKNLIWQYPLQIGALSSLLVLNRPEALLFVFYTFMILLINGIVLIKKKKATPDTLISKLIYFLFPVILLIGGYQIFRMGYFASILPNTFYAKKGGELYMSQGLFYLKDFLSTYWFSFAIIFLGITILLRSKLPFRLSKILNDGEIHVFIMSLLPLFYVLYSGGDYMHGRSLLMTFLLICIAINSVFERYTQQTILSFFYSIVSLTIIYLVSISQIPITNLAGRQINGIKDERFHFGFGYDKGEFKKYFNERITGQFNWANRGYYYKELSEALETPISVVMGNIGFFGYAAEENVNVMGSSLSDPYLSRFPIRMRGTIGHEGEAHYEYIFSRLPNFSYTPYVIWNEAAHFKYEKAEHSTAIVGDGDGSFIPVFDLSNTQFIDNFSRLIDKDVKNEIDISIVKYLNEVSKQNPLKNFKETTDFFGFLSTYWAPYASEKNKALFSDTRNKFWGQRILSNYEVFNLKLKNESEEFIYHTAVNLNKKTFLDNVKFAIENVNKNTNEYDYILSINDEKDLTQKGVTTSDSIIFDKVYGIFYVTPGPQIGDIKLSVDKGLYQRDNYILKLVYRIAKEKNSISVACNECKNEQVVYKHDPLILGESQDKVEIYLDITKEIFETGEIAIELDRPQGPAAFEVGIISVEVF